MAQHTPSFLTLLAYADAQRRDVRWLRRWGYDATADKQLALAETLEAEAIESARSSLHPAEYEAQARAAIARARGEG